MKRPAIIVLKPVIYLSRKDQSSREIEAKLSIRISMSNIFLKYITLDGHSIENTQRCWKPRKMAFHEKRIFKRKAVDDPYKNAAAITGHLWSENIAERSQSTVSRCLCDAEL